MIVSHVVASWESLSSRTIMGSVPSQIEFVWEEVPSDVEGDAGVLDVRNVPSYLPKMHLCVDVRVGSKACI